MQTFNLVVESPLKAVGTCYAETKEGSFTLSLLHRVEQNEAAWRAAKPAIKMKAAVVASEVYDHFGDYDRAELALARFDYDLREVLDALKKDSAHRQPHDFLPRMWLIVALTQARYRADDFHRTNLVMRECSEILDRLDPSQERFLGTRSRLLLMTGQSLRQTADYDEAIKHFTESIRFANARFLQKTPNLELRGPNGDLIGDGSLTSPGFTAAQRLAHWSTAKSLALGTGWIRYVTGRLASATNCLSTGSILLRALRDPIHRAYCQLMMAAVARAKDAHDPDKVKGTLPLMKDAMSGLSRHPLFSIRAHYELAVAYLHLRDQESAANEIRALNQLLELPASARFRRWECAAQILESRLHRQQLDFDKAIALAKGAFERAQQEQRPNWKIEALIAQGEALSKKNEQSYLDHGVACFEQARELSKNNPKTEAVCTLHLAQLYFAKHLETRARDELNRWRIEYASTVEHGFVRQLARSVESQLGYPDHGSVFVIKGDRLDTNLVRLEKDLVKRVLDLGLERNAEMRRLGLKTERQVQRLQTKHGLSRGSNSRRPRRKRAKPG